MEWVPGATPTAYLYDENKNVIAEKVVGDKDLTELLDMLGESGFVAQKKVLTLGEPLREAAFGGHYYKVYLGPGTYDEVLEIAAKYSHEGESAYLATITSEQENEFLAKLIDESGLDSVWIGAQDKRFEGKWSWVNGPEKGHPFWEGGMEGQAVDSKFVKWSSGEPNDVGEEDCGVLLKTGGWNDASCENAQYSVIFEFGTADLVLPPPSPPSPPPADATPSDADAPPVAEEEPKTEL